MYSAARFGLTSLRDNPSIRFTELGRRGGQIVMPSILGRALQFLEQLFCRGKGFAGSVGSTQRVQGELAASRATGYTVASPRERTQWTGRFRMRAVRYRDPGLPAQKEDPLPKREAGL